LALAARLVAEGMPAQLLAGEPVSASPVAILRPIFSNCYRFL
jgi:hypothetical protein